MRQRNVIRVAVSVAGVFLIVGLVLRYMIPEIPAIAELDSGKSVQRALTATNPEPAQLSLERENDQAEVFRRAFWRHPAPEDHIRHGERREWSDGSGVQRWDWFLAVDASESLTTYLLKKNPFQLITSQEVQTFPGTPGWFPKKSDGFEIHQSRGGSMTILFDPKTQRLYAKSEGHGFKPGVAKAQAEAAPQQLQSIGRLPNTPPPIPEPEEE